MSIVIDIPVLADNHGNGPAHHVHVENAARQAVLTAAASAARIQSELNDTADLTGLVGTVANQQEPATQAGILGGP